MKHRAWALLLALLVVFAVTRPALAADGESVGRNLGELLKGWATAVFAGVAALVSLLFLLNRRYNELALFSLAALLVGGFVFAPDAVAGTIENIWRTLAK
jgi:hypothetical protein